MSLAQLSQLLPLPEEDLKQVLEYAQTLSKQEAAHHFNNLLGESPQSIEFISAFNSRRQGPTSTSNASASPEISGVPKSTRKPAKKKAPLHTPAPRQIQDTYAAQGTAYIKKNEDDYVVKKPGPSKPAASSTSGSSSSNAFSLTAKPAATQAPIPKPPPSAAGTLISDFKTSNSRNPSPNPSKSKTKVNITGGTSMHGASTVLNDLDAAIRALEISTNSTLLSSKKRACNCIATRHPLLTAAPNCLSCGKVICVKEGLGPCTFCGTPLLSSVEVQGMISSLREERGREKMLLDNAAHKRAEVSKKPLPFTAVKDVDMSPAELKAKEHRDRLLGFQAQNAKRTTVRDEAADFDVDVGRGIMWSSPAERAKQLKRQQKILAEQEWNARPEYEKRRQVVSIDVVKGKVVKRMAAVERPSFADDDGESEEEEIIDSHNTNQNESSSGGGTFSKNPLLGSLIKPVWEPGKGKEKEQELEGLISQGDGRKKSWRRVQDDLEDNEKVILDGGALGGNLVGMDREEPDCG